jgi:hypothetical protein
MSKHDEDVLDFPEMASIGEDSVGEGMPALGFLGQPQKTVRTISVTLPCYPGTDTPVSITVRQTIRGMDVDSVVTAVGQTSSLEEYQAVMGLISHLS